MVNNFISVDFQTHVSIWFLISMKFCTRIINKKEGYNSAIVLEIPYPHSTPLFGFGSTPSVWFWLNPLCLVLVQPPSVSSMIELYRIWKHNLIVQLLNQSGTTSMFIYIIQSTYQVEFLIIQPSTIYHLWPGQMTTQNKNKAIPEKIETGGLKDMHTICRLKKWNGEIPWGKLKKKWNFLMIMIMKKSSGISMGLPRVFSKKNTSSTPRLFGFFLE